MDVPIVEYAGIRRIDCKLRRFIDIPLSTTNSSITRMKRVSDLLYMDSKWSDFFLYLLEMNKCQGSIILLCINVCIHFLKVFEHCCSHLPLPCYMYASQLLPRSRT